MFPGLVACPDGTMIDFKSGKVVVDPNRSHNISEWAPTKVISPPQVSPSWNGNSTPSSSDATQRLSDADSQKYWQDQANAEQAKQPEMSDEQKKLLADLEAGKLMKLSRLEPVDESLKKNADNSSKSVLSSCYGREDIQHDNEEQSS